MYGIHINYIFATSWFFCLFLPTSPFKAVCENEASQTVNSRMIRIGYVHAGVYITCIYAAFLPAVNTTSQPVNLPRTVSQVVHTTGELGVTRNFPNFDLHL